MRDTSIEAYIHLVEGGNLAKANRKVYEYLFHNGPTTQKKTERALKDTTYTMRPRFAQLQAMGLIKEVGSIPCEETGRRNILWDVTSLINPGKINRAKSVKDFDMDELITRLEKIENTTSDMFTQGDIGRLISWVKGFTSSEKTDHTEQTEFQTESPQTI